VINDVRSNKHLNAKLVEMETYILRIFYQNKRNQDRKPPKQRTGHRNKISKQICNVKYNGNFRVTPKIQGCPKSMHR
jgi:hypothetical protein